MSTRKKRVRKTIFMPRADGEAVLAALRDPRNSKRQGDGYLFSTDKGGYCCLGVAQCVKTGGFVEADSDGVFLGYPTLKWLNSVGWRFNNKVGQANGNPYLPTLRMHASEANDTARYTFAKIADAMEACMQFTD